MPAAKRAAKVDISPKRGRKKAPIERRRVRSSDPHKNRIGPADIPKAEADIGEFKPLPEKPPHQGGSALCEIGRECWANLVGPQVAKGKHAWLCADDLEAVLLVCKRYARWVQVWRETNRFITKNDGSVIDPETGRPHSLITIERQLSETYMSGLKSLGYDPSNRRVVESRDDKGATKGLA